MSGPGRAPELTVGSEDVPWSEVPGDAPLATRNIGACSDTATPTDISDSLTAPSQPTPRLLSCPVSYRPGEPPTRLPMTNNGTIPRSTVRQSCFYPTAPAPSSANPVRN